MDYDPPIRHRRSIRLRQYDYAQPGAYYITLVIGDRSHVFGDIEGNMVQLNAVGRMVEREWRRLSSRFPNAQLDAFVVMPNHVHGIIIISDTRTGTAANAHDLTPDEPRRAPSCTAANAHDLAPDESRRAPISDETRHAKAEGTADNAADQGLSVSRRAPTTHATFGAPIPGSLATIMRAFKSSTTLRMHRMRGSSAGDLWHRNYYEHVIAARLT